MNQLSLVFDCIVSFMRRLIHYWQHRPALPRSVWDRIGAASWRFRTRKILHGIPWEGLTETLVKQAWDAQDGRCLLLGHRLNPSEVNASLANAMVCSRAAILIASNNQFGFGFASAMLALGKSQNARSNHTFCQKPADISLAVLAELSASLRQCNLDFQHLYSTAEAANCAVRYPRDRYAFCNYLFGARRHYYGFIRSSDPTETTLLSFYIRLATEELELNWAHRHRDLRTTISLADPQLTGLFRHWLVSELDNRY